ncbi:MAG: hypothetical protein K9K32_04555 [Halanaerobiales bacterium]|nr:hypothetical protein [Halanaerobiales bacterium]
MTNNNLIKALKAKRNKYKHKLRVANNDIEINLYREIIHDLDRIIQRHEVVDSVPY